MEAGLGERGPTFETLLRLAHAQKMHLVVEFVPEADDDVRQDVKVRALREAF